MQAYPRPHCYPAARPVPQCTYSIADKHSGPLTTGRIWSCMAIAGVNKEKGIAFLAHLDTPVAAFGVKELFCDVKQVAGGDLKGFELHDISGLHPLLPGLALVVSIPALAFSIYVGVVLALFGVFFGSTRLTLFLRLRSLGIDVTTFTRHRPHCWFILHGKSMCTVNRNGDVRAIHDSVMDVIYKKPKDVWLRLVRRGL